MTSFAIRRLAEADFDAVAEVHARSFTRQGHSKEWIRCNAQAFPRTRFYVAEDGGAILGYVLWTEKSGFRENAVLELEQIAVVAERRRQGIGEALILESLPDVVAQLADRGAMLTAVLVTTRTDNGAQRLYRKTLGAEVEATVAGLYSSDEVVMVARNPLRFNNTPNAHARKSGARRLA